jgi:peptidoglycan/xylan/chitin deacetylase (PgdA/CDA1 family)
VPDAARPLALTFDDGPGPTATREIVAALARRDVAATFFVWGERAERHPDVVGELLDAGHSVAPHCWAHDSHLARAQEEIRGDVERVLALLDALGAPAPRLWRPPYGHLQRDGATREIAAELGLELAGWTVDTEDWSGPPAADMHRRVADAALAAGPGEPVVVLMHDGHREPGPRMRRPDAGNTVELVRRLTRDRRMRFVRLEQGLDAGLSSPGRSGP